MLLEINEDIRPDPFSIHLNNYPQMKKTKSGKVPLYRMYKQYKGYPASPHKVQVHH
jgi:hypothetical protein